MKILAIILSAIIGLTTIVPANAGDWRYRDHHRWERHHHHRDWRRERAWYRHQMRPRYHRHYHSGGDAAAALIVGGILGLAFGAAIANSAEQRTETVEIRCEGLNAARELARCPLGHRRIIKIRR